MTADPETVLAGRYQLGDLLGAGGMADVYRATDLLLGREVAVKLLRARPDDEEAAGRFRSEARTLAAVSNANVVTILDVSLPEAPQPYLVVEIIDGPSLSERLRATGPLDEAAVRALGGQLARGLDAAHGHGIIHRDVKPSNILLRADGTAVLTDFGIARLEDDDSEFTPTGRVIGSPAYLAPEQVRGTPPTPAVDIYALGLVLLESYTGMRSYPGPATEAAMARLSVAPAMPTSLPSDLRGLLTAMTDPDPAARPTAAEVVAVLDPTNAGPLPPVAPPGDVHTEELRLPPAAVVPDAASTTATSVVPRPASTARRTVLTAVAAGAALLAFWVADPVGLAAQDDRDPGPDQPSAPITPVADPQPTTDKPDPTPSPTAETPVGTRDGGGAGADRPSGTRKAAEKADDKAGPPKSSKGKGKGGGKGKR